MRMLEQAPAYAVVALNLYAATQMHANAITWNLSIEDVARQESIGIKQHVPVMMPLLSPIALALYKVCNLIALLSLVIYSEASRKMFLLMMMVYTVMLSVFAENSVSSALEINRVTERSYELLSFVLFSCLWISINAILLYLTLIQCTNAHWAHRRLFCREAIGHAMPTVLPNMSVDEVLTVVFD